MEGRFFHIQRVDLVQQDGPRTTDMEVIGHLIALAPRAGRATVTARTRPWSTCTSWRTTPSRSGLTSEIPGLVPEDVPQQRHHLDLRLAVPWRWWL